MKKRLLSVLLPAAMAASVLAGCTPSTNSTTAAGGDKGTNNSAANGTTDAGSSQGNSSQGAADAVTTETVEKGTLIIGTTTEPTGDFIAPIWQNNASDQEVIQFIEKNGTYERDKDNVYQLNKTVVEKVETKDEADGSKTYTFTIKDGLKFSDGSPIAAKDFVANVLFFSSKVISELKGKPTAGNYYKGYTEFMTGKSKTFEGVRLLDDKTFSVTLDKDYVPSYFETSLVSVGPVKLDDWCKNDKAGKVEVKDDGKGAYFSDNFTTENFKDSIMKTKNNPNRVTAGPYKVKAFDKTSKIVTFEIDPNYAGNWEGKKPSIKNIVLKKVTNATAMDELKTGGINFISQLTSGRDINAGFDLTENQPDKFAYFMYDRAGYGKLAFSCDIYPTKDVEVRQALTHLLDRDKLVQTLTSGFGSVVNGPYGTGEWMFKESQKELNGKLNSYAYDVNKAKELLDKAGWNLNQDGSKYSGTGQRYKKTEDGKIIPLTIKWGASEKNEVSEALVTALQKNPDVAAAGMVIEQTVMTFEELLNYLYRDASQGDKYGEPTYNMFNLGSGFPPAYVPRDSYTTDPEELKAGYNTNFIVDKELEKLAEGYWRVDPSEKAKFLKGYQDYLVKWNQLLPDIPLYSNQYHDFFTAELKGYFKTSGGYLIDGLLYSTME